jgi:hypothetical protein
VLFRRLLPELLPADALVEVLDDHPVATLVAVRWLATGGSAMPAGYHLVHDEAAKASSPEAVASRRPIRLAATP